MTNLESRLREALSDERRIVTPPNDITGWVAAGVRRRRRRAIAIGAAATAAALALGSVIVLPRILSDDPAAYVAGPPDARTGLLPWDPVGSLVEDTSAIEGAVDAWSDQASTGEQPVGDVYVLMAGDEVGGSGGAYLQGRSTDGDAVLAFLTRGDDPAVWNLGETTELSDPGSTELVVVPPRDDVDGSALAILAPKWREVKARWFVRPFGWSEVPSDTRWDETEWRQIYRSFPSDWLTAVGVPMKSDVAQRVLIGKGSGVARLVEVPASGTNRFVGVDTGTVVRSVDGQPPGPEVLNPGAVLADALRIGPDVRMTLIAQANRAAAVPPLSGEAKRPVQMSVILFEPKQRRPVIGAVVQTASGRAICGTRKFVPSDVVWREYVVAAVCPVTLSTGAKSLWLVGRWNIGEDIDPDLNLTLDVVSIDGSVATSQVTQSANGLLDEMLAPERNALYSEFVVKGLDPFEGTPFRPWVWPAQWLVVR